jgi:H+/Cl- antiporter ClcA
MFRWFCYLKQRVYHREYTALFKSLALWGVLGLCVGLLSGSASALFLHSLNRATAFREQHPGMLFLLPLAGLLIGWTYDRFGKAVAAGNNLLLDSIHAAENATVTIPFRLAPLVLFGTVVTHLFGGSAGREGTAVQMGGTLANLLTKPLRLDARAHRLLIMAGISGGFGSVFGTPLAGAVFGLEVLSIGSLDYEALIPCCVAAYVGDVTCRALGITHVVYHVGVPVPVLSPALWLLILTAGALFGSAAFLFSELTERITHVAKARLASPLLRPFCGGIAVIALTYIVGTRDYLGLSLPLIAQSFMPGGVVLWAFALKILFTSVTLGTGFKGGEVTPLFCIGATLGAAWAHLTHQPTGFFAALGFVSVFAGAANTPLACIFMGIELFGAEIGVPLAASCVLAYILSGHRSIYTSQRIAISKSHSLTIEAQSTVRDLHVDTHVPGEAPPKQ